MTTLVLYLLIFLAVGVFFVFFHLMLGKTIRPAKPGPEKLTIYECGEPTIGSSWVQFDLRFYVIALLFVIFDVEVVFFFPWAVVFGQANRIAVAARNVPQVTAAEGYREQVRALVPAYPETTPLSPEEVQADRAGAIQLAWLAFWDIVVFFGVLLVGFAYLWRRGDLDWVRSTAAESAVATAGQAPAAGARARELIGAGAAPYGAVSESAVQA
jgi:NADH-quinone oxidoreductase subunit A